MIKKGASSIFAFCFNGENGTGTFSLKKIFFNGKRFSKCV